MTNFKIPFAKYYSRRKNQQQTPKYNQKSKKSSGTLRFTRLVSMLLLLGICFNFAFTALAEEGSGGFGAISSAASNGAAGPPTPGSGGFGAISSGAANQGNGASGASGGFGAISSGAANGASSSPGSSGGFGAVSSGAFTSATPTNLLTQGVESAGYSFASNFAWLTGTLDWLNPNAMFTPAAQGIQWFWQNTLKDWFLNIGGLVTQWLEQVVMWVVEPIVKVLTSLLIQFAYNPDVSVGKDQFSLQMQSLARTVQFLSNDLLLLFFILSVWRYWANAAWKGGSMMGAVARIIVAASATIAWPTIYHYVILISNALTEYLINTNTLNASVIASAVANAITQIVTGQATFNFMSTMLGSGQLGALVLTPVVAVAQLFLVIAIGLAIVASIVVFFTMKVIQIIIVVAAFVFGPFFLCMLVSPDTEGAVSGFIKSFCETCLWTFVWTIFLMMFVFSLQIKAGANPDGSLTTVTQNPQNPWFVLFLELGFLQAMVQTPGYLSRGKISEAGEFLELYGLWKLGKAGANFLFGADGYGSKAFRYLKRNNPWGKSNTEMSLGGKGGLPTLADNDKNFNSLKNANWVGATAAGTGALAGTRLAGLNDGKAKTPEQLAAAYQQARTAGLRQPGMARSGLTTPAQTAAALAMARGMGQKQTPEQLAAAYQQARTAAASAMSPGLQQTPEQLAAASQQARAASLMQLGGIGLGTTTPSLAQAAAASGMSPGLQKQTPEQLAAAYQQARTAAASAMSPGLQRQTPEQLAAAAQQARNAAALTTAAGLTGLSMLPGLQRQTPELLAASYAQAKLAAASAMAPGLKTQTPEQLAAAYAQAKLAAASALGASGVNTGINSGITSGVNTGTQTLDGGNLPDIMVPGGSVLGSAIAGTSRSAIGRFSTSTAGGQGSEFDANSRPLVQKTSLEALGKPGNNPWLDMRGRRTNQNDYLTMFNLQKIRSGNVDLRQNETNPKQNAIHFDDAGNIQKLEHREGAGAQEIGMLSLVASLATMPYSDGKGHTDPRAVTATNNAVKNAHKWDAPVGRQISYWLSGGRVPRYVQNLENDRLEREKIKARIVGSEAYVKGERGNAYTQFLEWKFGSGDKGKMDDGTRAMLAYCSENTDAGLGGFNLNWEHGITRLMRSGLDVNPVTMGVASHEGILAFKPSEQVQVVPAVQKLVHGYLGQMGIDPQSPDVWNKSGIHWAATDGILRSLTPEHYRASRAIADIAGLNAITPQSVNAVMQVHKLSGQGEMAFAYERAVLDSMGRTQPPLQTSRHAPPSRMSAHKLADLDDDDEDDD